MSTETIDPFQAEQAIKFRQEVIEQNREVRRLKVIVDDDKEQYNASKKEWEAAQQELNNIIAEMSKDRPLFDQAQNQEEPEPEEEKPGWGITLIAAIDCLEPYEDALHDLGIIDAEGFVMFLDDGHDLTEIEGVGPKTAETLAIVWKDWLNEAEQFERIKKEPWRGKTVGNLMDYGVKEKTVNILQDAKLPLLDDVDQCGKDLTSIDGIGPKAFEAIQDALDTIENEANGDNKPCDQE